MKVSRARAQEVKASEGSCKEEIAKGRVEMRSEVENLRKYNIKSREDNKSKRVTKLTSPS